MVGSVEIDVVRKDIKNLHLGVYPPEGRVRIASPLHTNSETVRLFAISKLSWIKKQQKKFQEQPRETRREYIDRESHYFLGNRYLLKIIEHTGNNKVVIRNKKHLDLYIKHGATEEQRANAMREWYRRELKKRVPDIIHKWEQIIGVKANDWGIKQMRTKWGSCNPDAKRIWLNLELAKKPIGCIEYIIAHELVHLLERNHTARFTALMDQYKPDWRVCRKVLNGLPVGHVEW